MRWGQQVGALLTAAHIGPTVAVTVLATAYAGSLGMRPAATGLAAAAVLTGQLSIGWCNDLVDASRDRAVARSDKPLATGELSPAVVRVACALAVAATVPLSLACGVVAGLVHLVCVAAGWAYNLGLKSTLLSWLPYAVAFGGLTVFLTLAGPEGGLPAAWVPVAGALLGVGAHLVNVLPDLGDDAATGVRGLPHRVGERGTRVLSVVALGAASVVLALGAEAVPAAVLGAGLVAVAVLAGVALTARGRAPFRAAIG
ncbi:MAG TPA: UbiA family prenyltransferase, partial [Nocardioides sp.]|nr:UbiA family prenyltransferase [Nocardioides sp.]